MVDGRKTLGSRTHHTTLLLTSSSLSLSLRAAGPSLLNLGSSLSITKPTSTIPFPPQSPPPSLFLSLSLSPISQPVWRKLTMG
ncbi:uncharacterized protein BO88DRAFT_78408 [Aspergillus vadensis CBS 113365]|uniref:Uncharacterized protein n=1 Tax=Aspergillus vadensis (strain CBS 113365 / IMI 142717 / IBT 24658) TaxID=1448311 RepID=A0A319B603_ASPVC|nr:hypothetical protein BO88DRAFT_78408 [Aspergillus vadensis CBS 113365]PYH67234.1 hypothetical protein BO88DRAFT_78408 [Aspergillus vadensis CBS 113365]